MQGKFICHGVISFALLSLLEGVTRNFASTRAAEEPTEMLDDWVMLNHPCHKGVYKKMMSRHQHLFDIRLILCLFCMF